MFSAAAVPLSSQYKRDDMEDRGMAKALALLVLSAQGNAKPDCDALACEEAKQAIREIEARMRAGYSRSQGEKYETKLRKLKRRRSKLCR
jgi:hypothetical protein